MQRMVFRTHILVLIKYFVGCVKPRPKFAVVLQPN